MSSNKVGTRGRECDFGISEVDFHFLKYELKRRWKTGGIWTASVWAKRSVIVCRGRSPGRRTRNPDPGTRGPGHGTGGTGPLSRDRELGPGTPSSEFVTRHPSRLFDRLVPMFGSENCDLMKIRKSTAWRHRPWCAPARATLLANECFFS